MSKMRRGHGTRLSTDSSKSEEEGNIIAEPTVESLVPPPQEDENREASLEPILSSQGSAPQAGPRVGPGRRSRYSMNYQSYEATRIQPAEQTRRMLDYMFPGYQKRDPRNWYEKATQTTLNRDEVTGLIGIELTEVEPIEAEENRKSVVDRISHIPVDDEDDDDGHSPVKQLKFQKPHARSSFVAKGWDGPPIKVTGKTSEEGFHIEIHDLQHEPQAIMVPKDVFDQKTLRLDVIPDERGVPKVVVYVGDKDRRSSEITIDSNVPEASTVVLFDNKDAFNSPSVSTTSEVEPVEEKEEEEAPQSETAPHPKPFFILEPVNIPSQEFSSADVVKGDLPARDSVGRLSDETRIEIEYDLDEEPQPDVDDEEPTAPLEIVNSRLLEPVHSQGDKDDVDVDLVPSSIPEQPVLGKSDSDQNLSKEVSDWLAVEIFPKAMTPRRSESPRKKSETPEPLAATPEPKAPTPEPKEPTPEPKAPSPEPKAPTPEPSPVPPPEPERNLSKEVSDWLNDNILNNAKQQAADRKMSKEVSDWLRNNILADAKQAADLSNKPKPAPPEPITVPEPVSEPSFTKAGSHASSPEDRLFGPLENYPNNMDEDDLTSKNIPTVPLITPSQVSKEDEPLKALEDYPPQYSSSRDSPSTSRKASDSKSVSPKALPSQKPEPALKAGSHSSSPGDRLFSPLEDHPSNVSDEPANPKTSQSKTPSPLPQMASGSKSPSLEKTVRPKKHPVSNAGSHSSSPGDRLFGPLEDHPSNVSDERESPKTSQSKTSSPKPIFESAVISIEDKEHEPSPLRDMASGSKSPSPVSTLKPEAISIEDKKRDSLPTLDRRSRSKSPSLEQILQPKPAGQLASVAFSVKKPRSDKSPSLKVDSDSPFVGVPIKKDDQMGPNESDVSEWLDEDILMPAAAEGWVENKILKKAQVLARESKKYSGVPTDLSVGVEPKTGSFKRSSSADQTSPSGMEEQVEEWMENEVLIPAQVDNWVDKKILKPAQRAPDSEQDIPESGGPPIQQPRASPSSAEIDGWISEEIVEPAAASSWVHSEVLRPAEVSVAVEEQIIGPASSRALEPSPPASIKSPSKKSRRSLKFDTPVMPGEDTASPVVKGPLFSPLESNKTLLEPKLEKAEKSFEKKPADDDSLSWVDSSKNLSPFQPHPDHPGDGPKSQNEGDAHNRFPQFPDQTYGLPPDSAPPMFGKPVQGVPTPVYGQPQQLQPSAAYEQPTAFTAPSPRPPTQGGPPSPVHGQQPDATTAQPAQAFPSPTPLSGSEQPTLLPSPHGIPAPLQSHPSHDAPASIIEQPAPPLEPKEPSLLPSSESYIQSSQLTSPKLTSSQLDVEPSWGKQVSTPNKEGVDGSRGPSYKKESGRSVGSDKTRESILKNAVEHLDEVLAARKSPPPKTETRTSLIEKRAIQQDNYLTRDDDEDYKARRSQKLSKGTTSSSSSTVQQRRSDSFLSGQIPGDKSPSLFSRLCSPLSKMITKHKSPPRTKKSTGSSYDSDFRNYDDAIPPIPTKEYQPPKPDLKGYAHRRKSSSHSDLSEETWPPSKSSKPEPIREESAEGSVPQQPDTTLAGQPTQIEPLPVNKQSGPSLPAPVLGPDQGAGSPMYGQPPQQPGSGAPSPIYEQPMPMYGQPTQEGFPSSAYGDPSQVGQPSSLPHQGYSPVGAPTPLESKYPEDIQTSTLPRFSDYEEAAKRRMKPEESSDSPRIPHPPKKGFPTFPDYKDLTTPKEKLAAHDHSWYDAEEQPAPSPYASRDLFSGDSGNSVGKKISAEITTTTIESPIPSEVPHHIDTSTSAFHSKASDIRKEDGREEKSVPAKYGPARPMPPGNGIPLFSDYYDSPAGQFPIFRDSPKMASSHYRPKDNRQPPGISLPSDASRSSYGKLGPSNSPYPTQPLQSSTAPVAGASQPRDAGPFTGPQTINPPELPSVQRSDVFPPEQKQMSAPTSVSSSKPQKPWTQLVHPTGSATPPPPHLRTPWEVPSSRPQGSVTHPVESHSQRPWETPTSRPQSSATYPAESRLPGEIYSRPQGFSTHQLPHAPRITRHSYSHPDRPLSELMQPNLPVPQQASNLYPEKQPTQDGTAHLQETLHLPDVSSHDFVLQGLPTFQKPDLYAPQKQYARPDQTYDPSQLQPAGYTGQQMPPTQSKMPPTYKTPQPPRPWEIPSSRPYSPPHHQMPTMHRPGDYDQRQMFDPQGLPKQKPGSWPSAPAQEPYSASSERTPTERRMPSMGIPGDDNRQHTSDSQGLPKRASGASAPGEKPHSDSGQTPQPSTFTKHYYLQPDRPLSELLQPQIQNRQQGSPVPNFQGERPGGSRKENSPLAPGGGIPKFGDYDELIQSSQPQISGDHDPNQGKRKIVTAAEKKAQIEREMLPITEQMNNLKKQMYLLTPQKGPPIRTGPHSAYTRLPTSMELYQELERRTMDATKKDREEFRAERRKQVYEENARRRIRRAIERSKTTK